MARFNKIDLKGRDNSIRKWVVIVSFQTIFMLAVIVWAITQKVEADKQTVLSIIAKEEAYKSRAAAERAKDNANRAETKFLMQTEETLKYKELYEQEKLLNKRR